MCFLFGGVLVVRFLQVCRCFLQSLYNDDRHRTAELSITVTSPGVQYCHVSNPSPQVVCTALQFLCFVLPSFPPLFVL
jgi:hypothetical protein